MNSMSLSRRSRWLIGVWLLPWPAQAGLSLDAAEHQALDRQPGLAALAAQSAAARSRAISDAQLPDPELMAEIANLPVNGSEAYSLRSDFMTMTSLGIAQSLPDP